MAQLDYRTRAISSLSTDDTDSEDSCDSSAALPGRRRSMSFVAVRSALYQLTCLSDFKTEKLGSGFFAEVFKVTHNSTGEVMVLKLNKNRKNSRQMLAEIQLLNRLSHPNILGFKGSCVHEGQLHALTEYINGGTLEDFLHNPKLPLSWSVRLAIALDIAKGMAYLHSKGVFHRDLTSKNCLIQLEGDRLRTVVADFGLAAKIKQKRRSYTEVVGSPYWMAPECLHGREYGEQADVFSFGIILAEIMSRVPADPDFMPRTEKFGIDFECLYPMCPGCPDRLWDLMAQCSKLDPDERPTFNEVVEILESIDASKCISENLSNSYSEPSIATALISPSPEPVGESEETIVTNVLHSLDAQLSSLLEGSDETDSVPRKELIVPARSYFLDRKNEDSGIDTGSSWQKNSSDLYHTPVRNESPGLGCHTPNSNSVPPYTYNFHAPQASDSSEISFHLPPPSFAWAPPPSPAHMHRVSQSYPSSPTSPRKASVLSLDGYFSSPEASPTLRQRRLSDSGLFHFPHNPPPWATSGKGATRCSCWPRRYSRTSSDPLDAKPLFLDECVPQVEDQADVDGNIAGGTNSSVGECRGRLIPDTLRQNLDKVAFSDHCSSTHYNNDERGKCEQNVSSTSASFSLTKVLEASPSSNSSSCSSCGSNRELDRLTHVCTSASNLQIC